MANNRYAIGVVLAFRAAGVLAMPAFAAPSDTFLSTGGYRRFRHLGRHQGRETVAGSPLGG
ncbi:MAG TPA: hypothetical protein VHJ18_01675 [Streptosporangiaceae bacterium]|nr:hypothetical protein [Streptosporangiaceae bacterium]